MKRNLNITVFFTFITIFSFAQDSTFQASSVVPQAKTRAEQIAERKNKSLKQKIESAVPISVQGPKATLKLPGNTKISSVEDAKKFMNETIPNLAHKAKDNSRKARKALKKAKEAIFDGKFYEKYPIQKKIYKRGSGSRMQYQVFYVLKDPMKPNPYLRNVFWYDEKRDKIVEALTRDEETNRLLHGPFQEYRGETLIKEGYYYLGAKHGRWNEFDRDFVLKNKETFNKGFYEDAKISYYDGDSTKIKEVMPEIYGKVSGPYYRFYEDDTLAEEGKMDNGKKVGKWIEYFEGGIRRKKETQYPADCYDPAEPKLMREYDKTGKLIFENLEK